jgi:DNA helicase HerA-like ATPase
MSTSKSDLGAAFPQLVTSDFSATDGNEIPREFHVVGKLVYWNSTPTFGKVGVLLDPNQEVRPGQFLAAWHGRRNRAVLTVVQVGDCCEINPNEEPELAAARERLGLKAGYAGEDVSTRIFRLAGCETIEDLEIEIAVDGTFKVLGTKAPESLTRAGDPVVLLPDELAQDAIGSLRDPAMGLHVGSAQGIAEFNVTLRPPTLQMHCGLFGNPGKGKSYLGGVLLEEAHKWSVPTLVLDINGEFIELAQSLSGLVISLPDRAQFGLSLNLLTPPELVSIAPNVQPHTQYGELIELAHDQLRNEKRGRDITFDELRARISDLGDSLKTVKTSVGAALSRITALERDPLIGPGTSFDFIKALIKHRIVVLDCRYLSLRQTQLIAAAAARTLQHHGREMTQKANKGDKDAAAWFSLLFIDEAHAVAPSSEDVVSTQVLYELARMGRHVRTGMILSSQSPADLDRSILKRLQTRFVFALEKDQLSAIGGVSSDLGQDLQAQLPKLARGVCGVSGSSELIKHGFLLKVRSRKTPVGGSTPPVFGTRFKAAER